MTFSPSLTSALSVLLPSRYAPATPAFLLWPLIALELKKKKKIASLKEALSIIRVHIHKGLEVYLALNKYFADFSPL